jgi:3-methyl-2-oxobutanoate hydroxymethyltransferase
MGITLDAITARKGGATPLVMVTAYDLASAQAAEEAGVDLVLVGDTAAMTTLGYPGTEAVALEEMLNLGRAVRRGLQTPLMVGDLPMGTYEAGDDLAVRSAHRMVKETGCDVVKLEGAGTSAERARAIVDSGIAVMGHVGLTPQTSTALGGFRTQAKSASAALELLQDALAVQAAGCFAVVLEAVPGAVAEDVTARLAIPTIGIGAGSGCDGQVLVFNDLIDYETVLRPRFVKRYAQVGRHAREGVAAFAADVRARRFPG